MFSLLRVLKKFVGDLRFVNDLSKILDKFDILGEQGFFKFISSTLLLSVYYLYSILIKEASLSPKMIL